MCNDLIDYMLYSMLAGTQNMTADLNVSFREKRTARCRMQVRYAQSINHVCSCGIPVTEIDKTLNISRAMPGRIRRVSRASSRKKAKEQREGEAREEKMRGIGDDTDRIYKIRIG